MNKKTIIGFCSIGAVLLIILSSFVSVAGVEYLEKKNSPLYSFRANRAIKSDICKNEDKKTEYIGKGLTFISSSFSDIELLKKQAIYRIQTMSDSEFGKLINDLKIKLLNEKTTDEKQTSNIIVLLNSLRDNSEKAEDIIKNMDDPEPMFRTWFAACLTLLDCAIMIIECIFIYIVEFIIHGFTLACTPTEMFWCGS